MDSVCYKCGRIVKNNIKKINLKMFDMLMLLSMAVGVTTEVYDVGTLRQRRPPARAKRRAGMRFRSKSTGYNTYFEHTKKN
jgi:hypothetical protein